MLLAGPNLSSNPKPTQAANSGQERGLLQPVKPLLQVGSGTVAGAGQRMTHQVGLNPLRRAHGDQPVLKTMAQTIKTCPCGQRAVLAKILVDRRDSG